MNLKIKISPPVSNEELARIFAEAWGWKKEACPDFSALLNHALFYVCGYIDGTLIGFAKVIWDGGEHAFLLDPAVSPEHRMKGAGKQIVRASARESAARGLRWLHVDFDAHLAPFYRSCGFRPTDAGLIDLRELIPNESTNAAPRGCRLSERAVSTIASQRDVSSLCCHSATTLARMIRERQVTAVEVVRAHLERIEQINPALNAVIEIAPESSLEQARDADAAIARGEPVGPFHGVPFTVKDVYEVRDCARLVTAPGMASRPGERATRDSTAVVRLRAAGAIFIGVTKATVWSDREERYGLTHNPYDLTRTPGGSSGGEAATISAGGSPLGLGSDSGGSLREPAHFCGIATIRPSNGRVPQSPDAGENDPRTASGPLARTVEDVAMALEIVSGFDWADPMTIPAPLANWREVSLAGLRVSVFSNNGIVAPTRETVATVESAARALANAGMIVDEERPSGLDESWEITLAYWKWGDTGNLKEYKTFLSRWHRYKLRMLDYMRKRDLVLCPVEAFPAPLVGKSEIGTGPSVTYTTPFSLVGWPVAAVRAGASAEGLPIGVQLAARPWRDDIALAAAAVVEAASGGWQPPPPITRRPSGHSA